MAYYGDLSLRLLYGTVVITRLYVASEAIKRSSQFDDTENNLSHFIIIYDATVMLSRD